MADRSAAVLVELLLAERPMAHHDALCAALAADPPLVLWTICAAREDDAFRPTCLADVAEWLARHAAKVLRARPRVEDSEHQTSPSSAEAWADRVAHAVILAEIAGQLAAAEMPELVESAQFHGLLADSADWLARAGLSPEDAESSFLPVWLAEPVPPPFDALIARAAKLLDDGERPADEKTLADSVSIDLDACRRRGADSRRHWLKSLDGLGDWLPTLAAKLDRLATLDDEFQRQLEAEKLEAMAEFAAGAGHEINNPLTVISGRAQLFLRGEQDPERRRALALISAQAMRVYEMIADMMLFARPPQPETAPIDLGELVDRLIDEMGPEAGQLEIVLRRGGQPGPIEIEADANQLTVALRAMCQNAVEAIGRKGRIEIALREVGDTVDPDGVEIDVANDGPSITPDERRHLFDPYYSARQAGRGLGLGLSKCWRIVTNHHGRIDVASAPGQGARFTITLPRRQPD